MHHRHQTRCMTYILIEIAQAMSWLSVRNARLLTECELFAFGSNLKKRNRWRSHRARLNEGWNNRHGASRRSATLPLSTNGPFSVFHSRPDRRASPPSSLSLIRHHYACRSSRALVFGCSASISYNIVTRSPALVSHYVMRLTGRIHTISLQCRMDKHDMVGVWRT